MIRSRRAERLLQQARTSFGTHKYQTSAVQVSDGLRELRVSASPVAGPSAPQDALRLFARPFAAVTFFPIDQDRADVNIVVFRDEFRRRAGLGRQVKIRSTPVALVSALIELHDLDPLADRCFACWVALWSRNRGRPRSGATRRTGLVARLRRPRCVPGADGSIGRARSSGTARHRQGNRPGRRSWLSRARQEGCDPIRSGRVFPLDKHYAADCENPDSRPCSGSKSECDARRHRSRGRLPSTHSPRPTVLSARVRAS